MMAVKCSTPNMPRLLIVKVPPLVWAGVSFRSAARATSFLRLRAELGDGLGVGVPDDRDDQAALRRHRDADVDPVVHAA